MSSLKLALSQLEARLQSLVEGSADRLFPGSAAQRDMIRGLILAMQTGVHPGSDGSPTAPNQYMLWVNPADVERLRQNRPFLDELARLLHQACQEAGLSLSGPLSLNVEADPGMAPGDIQVTAHDSLQNVTPTVGLLVPPSMEEVMPRDAFLIVDGMQVFPLKDLVVNIGRRPDNQLVVDDPRVSRLHAQLRLVRGRFIIFDLESTGGTFVNGNRIHQQVLYPGDVISLAGVPLVFGQEGFEPDDTQKVPVISS